MLLAYGAGGAAGTVGMMRKLFNLGAVLSLLLCAATIVLWTRSRTCSDYWGLEKYKRDGAPLWEAAVQASGRV
jgi:hypothetical protein